jgi:hypothetical protein
MCGLGEIEQAIEDSGWYVMWLRDCDGRPHYVKISSENIYGEAPLREGGSAKSALLKAFTVATKELAKVSGRIASLMIKTAAITPNFLGAEDV